jgi:threonylcarbamoyladenosine tRNA methylthiotransferase MtaB
VRIHLSALGCRLNEAELEQWATAFKGAGDQITNRTDDADVLVMNTCAVTKEAVRKSRQKLQRLQRENPSAKLVVSGCYSELAPATEMAELGVDLIVPNTQKDNLVALTRSAFTDPGMPQAATIPATTALFNRNRHRAFIKIQDGCRYRCTFCIVTVARGAERSRTISDIIDEVQQLQSEDVKEIVLTGVHVGGYGSDLDTNLDSLVKALLAETDIPRIRFASVEPWDRLVREQARSAAHASAVTKWM